MANAPRRFEITLHSTAMSDQLAIEWPGVLAGAQALARRLGMAIGRARLAELVTIIRDELTPLSPPQRLLLALDRSAKVFPWEHEVLAEQLGVRYQRKGSATAPSCLDELQSDLAALRPADGARVLRALWSRLDDGAVAFHGESWVLHALSRDFPAPGTVHLAMKLEALAPGVLFPEPDERRALRDLALRVLGLQLAPGPIAALGELLSSPIPERLPFLFEVAVTDRTPRSALLHVLTTPELSVAWPLGTKALSPVP